MVQPKKPPVSIRIPDELASAVAAFATKRKITRNAAYARLLADGLKANGPSLPAPEVQAEMKAAVVQAQAKVAKPKPTGGFTPREDTYQAWMRGKK